MNNTDKPDIDPIETQEWRDAFEDVLRYHGQERGRFLLTELAQHMLGKRYHLTSEYVNTITTDEEPEYPGDEEIENKIKAITRWNAVCTVLHATKKHPDIGGHLATFASAAVLYSVGWLHCFKGPEHKDGADLVFFQGHAAPGMYAFSYLDGRITDEQMNHFREEAGGNGLSSYPHPKLMPEFWQFATVSMGLGPLQAIYQARFLKYLDNRGLVKTTNRKVWAFCGDGEMDEPESTGALHIAAKEGLDNLIFVVNCNLQRLDGPVRGNSSVVRELEGVFTGSGWEVIKVLWGSNWDQLFAKDTKGLLSKRMAECVDGEYQAFRAKDGAYIREHFFGKYPELLEMVSDMSDDEIWALKRGGHDPHKVFAAYQKAMKSDRPVVVLAQTVKGYGLPQSEGQNTTHNLKKMTLDQLKGFRDRFQIPIDDQQIDKMPFYKPAKNSEELSYLSDHRKQRGGFLPSRRTESDALPAIDLKQFSALLESTGDREASSTVSFVRILNTIMKDKALGPRVVPIVPDECRSFGMEGMFRQYGIYSSVGQLYEPVDRDQLMYYREDKKGQIFEEGLTEAGAFCTWIAAGTSYSTNNYPMIPFYIYYSMFGFQRIGDLAWAAGDMQARGFLIGAISGRTSLPGEGLQHQDGHSHVLANTIPNCVTYDPCYGYELAVIIQHGLKRMYHDLEHVFYYITITNESYTHPEMPKGCEEGIIKGMYLFKPAAKKSKHHVNLLASGTMLREAVAASELLQKDFNVGANVFSVTSFNELTRDVQHVDRWNGLHPNKKQKQSYVLETLSNHVCPTVAVSDYIRLYTEPLRQHVPGRYYTLGTDGFGLSDTREALRAHFETDRHYIAIAALRGLCEDGVINASDVAAAIKKYNINPDKLNPVTV